jgi:pyrrolidone-carboxylate peptidase
VDERVDHVPVVDLVNALAAVAGAPARVGDDPGRSEPGLDPVVVDVDAQAMADQPGRRAVEDAVHEEAAGARHAQSP